VTKKLERALKEAKSDNRGLPISAPPYPPIRATRLNQPRALCIFDALFRGAEERGFVVSWPDGRDAKLTIVVEGHAIAVRITERVNVVREHVMTEEEVQQNRLNYWWRPPKYDCHPTGKFTLYMQSLEFARIRRRREEKRRRRLENMIAEVLEDLAHLGRESSRPVHRAAPPPAQ